MGYCQAQHQPGLAGAGIPSVVLAGSGNQNGGQFETGLHAVYLNQIGAKTEITDIQWQAQLKRVDDGNAAFCRPQHRLGKQHGKG